MQGDRCEPLKCTPTGRRSGWDAKVFMMLTQPMKCLTDGVPVTSDAVLCMAYFPARSRPTMTGSGRRTVLLQVSNSDTRSQFSLAIPNIPIFCTGQPGTN